MPNKVAPAAEQPAPHPPTARKINRKRAPGDGSLYKIRGGKLWRGVVDQGISPITGKRVQRVVHAKTQAACRDKLEALQKEIKAHGVPLAKRVTLDAFAQRWLNEKVLKTLGVKTFDGYRSCMNNHMIPKVGAHMPMNQITASHVQSVVDAIFEKGLSLSLAKQAHTAMGLMFDYAIAERIVDRNPVRDVAKPGKVASTAPEPVERVALEDVQAVAVLRAASALPGSAGSRWWMKMLTGMRQAEILGARLDDLDLDARTYRVRWQIADIPRIHGCNPDEKGITREPVCGKKQGAACSDPIWRVPNGFVREQIKGAKHFIRPKSSAGLRTIPLPVVLAEPIRRWLDATAAWPNPHGLIWRNPDGSPIARRVDDEQWRALLVAAKIIAPEQNVPGGTELTGHVARHTAVTILSGLGVDKKTRMAITGHASEAAHDNYDHARETATQAAVEKLAAALTLPAA